MSDNFWLFTSSGALETYGVPSYGSPTGPLYRPLVTTIADHAQTGYWLVASDGGVFAYGSAGFFGSTGDIALNQPIVGFCPDPRRPWATGWWPPTGACSPSVTPASTARPATSCSTSPSSA